MERFICVVVGYCFGLVQTSYIFGKLHGFDIRRKGSGNAGTTNAIRTMGWKIGIVTLLIDIIKCFSAAALIGYIYRESEIKQLLVMYTVCGVVLGHDFPVYLKFKGGKGVAVIVGAIVALEDWRIMTAAVICFLIPFLITRYVSLGSLTLYLVFFVSVILLGHSGVYNMTKSALYEMYVLSALLTVLAFWKHRQNIKRLIEGKENKLF